MGIQRGSLYGAFGGKQQLFLEALDRYEERFYRTMVSSHCQRRDRCKTASLACLPRRRFGLRLRERESRLLYYQHGGRTSRGRRRDRLSRVRKNLRRVEDAFEAAL